MFLPENKKIKKINKYEALIWFIIGKPMTGKSTFANQFPNALLLNTDGNHFQFETPHIYFPKNEYISLNNTAGQNASYHSWEYFKLSINELIKNSKNFKTVIIDLIEDFYDLCENYVLSFYKKKTINELGSHGGGYVIVEKEFFSVIDKLRILKEKGINVILLSHQKIISESIINEITAQTSYGSVLRTKISNKLESISHIIGRCVIKEEVIKTDKGPNLKYKHFLKVREPDNISIAQNRIQIPENEFELSYKAWLEIKNKLN